MTWQILNDLSRLEAMNLSPTEVAMAQLFLTMRDYLRDTQTKCVRPLEDWTLDDVLMVVVRNSA